MQSVTRQLLNNVMMALESSITLIGDQRETFSSRKSSKPRFKVDKGMTKGEFIGTLKELDDYRLLGSLLASRHKELQNKGL